MDELSSVFKLTFTESNREQCHECQSKAIFYTILLVSNALLISFAAVFRDDTMSGEFCVTCRKTAAKETETCYVRGGSS